MVTKSYAQRLIEIMLRNKSFVNCLPGENIFSCPWGFMSAKQLIDGMGPANVWGCPGLAGWAGWGWLAALAGLGLDGASRAALGWLAGLPLLPCYMT